MKKSIVVAVRVPNVLRAEDLLPYVRRSMAGTGLEVTGVLIQPGGIDENGNALLYVRGDAEEADAARFMSMRRIGDRVRIWTLEEFDGQHWPGIVGDDEKYWQEEYLMACWRSFKFRPYGSHELLAEMARGLEESVSAPAYLILGLVRTVGDGNLRGFLALPFLVGWLTIRPLFMPFFHWLDERRRKRFMKNPRFELWS